MPPKKMVALSALIWVNYESTCIRISRLVTLGIERNCLKCLFNGRDISTRFCFLQLNPMIDHTISLHKNPSIFLKQFLLR